MPILLVSFFLSISSLLACELNSHKPIFSLAGPVTVVLKELALLESPQLKGISVFHPVTNYKREVLPGGVFLGHSLLEKMRGHVVFFDESQQLHKTLKTEPTIKGIEIKTRGKSPSEVTSIVVKELLPYLSKCELKLKQLEDKQLLLMKQLKKLAEKQQVIFFLGRITERYPDLVMVNDGVVKWLVEQENFKSYPSELAYVSWSAKVLTSLPSSLKVGLLDSANRDEKKVERGEKGINLTYPGILIPGLSQVEGFIFLFESISSRP